MSHHSKRRETEERAERNVEENESRRRTANWFLCCDIFFCFFSHVRNTKERKIQSDFMSPLRYTNVDKELRDNRPLCDEAPLEYTNGDVIMCRFKSLQCDTTMVFVVKIAIGKCSRAIVVKGRGREERERGEDRRN